MTQPLSPQLLPIVSAPTPMSGENGTGDPLAFSRELHRELQRDALDATRRVKTGPVFGSQKPATESKSAQENHPHRGERDGKSSSRDLEDRAGGSSTSTTETGTARNSSTEQEHSDTNKGEDSSHSSGEEADVSEVAEEAPGAAPVEGDHPRQAEEMTLPVQSEVDQTAEQGNSLALQGEVQSQVIPAGTAEATAPAVDGGENAEQSASASRQHTASQLNAEPDTEANGAQPLTPQQETGDPDQQQSGDQHDRSALSANTTNTTGDGEKTDDRRAATSSVSSTPSEVAASPASALEVPELPSATEEGSAKADLAKTADTPKDSRSITAPLPHRLHSSQLAGRQARNEVESHGPVDASRFVSRVTRAFQAAEQRGGTIQLRLSPPELGAMRIELSVQQGVLSARLETETQAARSVLLDNLPALRERLAAQDIRVDKFDVDVQQEGSGKRDHWQPDQQGSDRRQSRSSAPASPVARAAEPGMLSSDEIPRPTLPLDGHLNVIA